MKKYLLINLKIIAIGVILAIGTSYAFARPWTCPKGGTATPCPLASATANNVATPVTVSSTDEIKTGDLSVLGFTATGAASFGSKVFFPGIIHGGTLGTNGKVTAKGTTTVAFGDLGHLVGTKANGTLATGDTITVTALANAATDITNAQACANENGVLVLCSNDVNPDLCPNLDGPQTTILSGYWKESDGNCYTTVDVCANIPGPQPSVPNGYTSDADKNCFIVSTPTATPYIARSCDADPLSNWTISWNGYGWFDWNESGSEDSPGTFDLGISFDTPLKEDMQLDFKACITQPMSENNFFGYETHFNAYANCINNTVNKTFGWHYHYQTNPIVPGVYATWLNSPNTKPITMTVPRGATSVVVPNLPCVRSGRNEPWPGSDKTKWSSITADAWKVKFTPSMNVSTVQTTVTFKSPVLPLCTNAADQKDSDRCQNSSY
jgi:hypothetical protein